MTDTGVFMAVPTDRRPPVPRAVRLLAVATVAVAVVVLGLGALITTFGVGMADPVWPTEPWFLAVNGRVWVMEPARGFLIEHVHRLAAWGLGGLALVSAVAAWVAEPHPGRRRFGLVAIAVLLGAYMWLHADMRSAWDARRAGEGFSWPAGSPLAVALGLALTAWAVVLAAWPGAAGRGVRVLATLGLVAVMVQGLLGGFRVFLHQLIGPELAAVHGAFGQLTFALLLSAAAVAGVPRVLPAATRRDLFPAAAMLLAATVAQLTWGVWVRHGGSPAGQRLHILTAFVVVGLAVRAAMKILADPAARGRLGLFAYHFLAVVAVQVALGVEAYLGKFAAGSAVGTVTLSAAAVRTGHALVGALLLGSAAVLVVRVVRRPASVVERVAPAPLAAVAERELVGV